MAHWRPDGAADRDGDVNVYNNDLENDYIGHDSRDNENKDHKNDELEHDDQDDDEKDHYNDNIDHDHQDANNDDQTVEGYAR